MDGTTRSAIDDTITRIADATTGERVIVYGLSGDNAKYNALFAHVQCYDRRRNLFCVAFADPKIDMGLWVNGRNLFFCSHANEYFARPVDKLDWITDFTAVRYDADCRPSVVATKPIPAGALLACPSFRVALTRDEIRDIEDEFQVFLQAQLAALMGRTQHLERIVFETNYNPVLPFIGAVAKAWRHPSIVAISFYDPVADACLEQEWRKLNGPDLLWYEFWRTKLAPLPALDVWHVWHLVRNYPWPSLDRRSLVFGQTVCLMQCHPKRLLEYDKVIDGELNANEDTLQHEYLSSFMMTPPECGPAIKAYFLQGVDVGQPVYTDNGVSFVVNPCDSILSFLFMDPPDAKEWFTLYKNVLGNLGKHVANSFIDYVQANTARVKRMKQSPNVRTTPLVLPPADYVPQDLPRCAHAPCGRPMQRPRFCSQCRAAQYCGRECQTAAWPTHKAQCKPAAK